MSGQPRYEVHWPLGPVADLSVRHLGEVDEAAGIGDLSGKRVAFVTHFGFRPDEMQTGLRRELTASYPGLEFLDYEQFGDIHGADEPAVIAALPDRVREAGVEAAIVGTAA